MFTINCKRDFDYNHSLYNVKGNFNGTYIGRSKRLGHGSRQDAAPGLNHKHEIRHKGAIDLVTEMDGRSEQFLIEKIRSSFPKDKIISEESGDLGGEGDAVGTSTRWMAPPITLTACLISTCPSATR